VEYIDSSKVEGLEWSKEMGVVYMDWGIYGLY